jgi:hypothetical protein
VDILLSLPFNSAFKYAIRKVQENVEVLEMSVTHQLLVCIDDVNMLGKNTNAIRKNTEILLDVSDVSNRLIQKHMQRKLYVHVS